MKCPNRKAGLKDTAPFPHEYANSAEYLLKMIEYNMRVRMWDFIRAATKTDPAGTIPPRQVLALALKSQSKKMQGDADELLSQEIASDETDRLLKELGF